MEEFVAGGGISESGSTPRSEREGLVPGGTYLAAVMTYAGKAVPVAGAVWQLDGDDVLRNPQSPPWAQDLAAYDVAGIAEAFAQTPPVEWARPYLDVEDGSERLFVAQRARSAVVTQERADHLIDSLRRFAATPTNDAFVGLGLAPRVSLGLGPQLVRTVPMDTLRDPSAWVLDPGPAGYAGGDGPFDVLAPLREDGPYGVVLGEHPHCASPARPAPAAVADAQRVSTQPRETQSCLRWSTVDLFVEDGKVVAITLDLWEP